MSLLDQPGIDYRYLDTVIFVRQVPGADPDRDPQVMQPQSDEILCYSEKIPAGRSYILGKPENATNWRITVDHTPGELYPFDNRHFVWHSRGSDLLSNGTPDYDTSLTIQSVVEYDTEGVAQIEASRTRSGS